MGANAQTAVPAFTAGQVLTAAQMTQVNTGIPVFASSTERDAAFGGAGEKTLAEGQYAFLEDTNETQVYDGSAWAAVGQAGGKILQVVSTTLSTVYSASIGGFSTTATIPGLTATITPSDTSSKILVLVNATGHSNQYGSMPIRLMRDTTHIGGGTASGSMPSMTFHSITGDAGLGGGTVGTALQISGHYLDSPATTSAITYGIQIYNFSSVTQTIAINETYYYTSASNPRSSSMITVMEVAA